MLRHAGPFGESNTLSPVAVWHQTYVWGIRVATRRGRMRSNLRVTSLTFPMAATSASLLYRLSPPSGSEDGKPDDLSFGRVPAEGEDLPYKVELWDESRQSIEQILAVTANGSIGFAAYYAATREFPHRYITLRHKNSIVSRWNGPSH